MSRVCAPRAARGRLLQSRLATGAALGKTVWRYVITLVLGTWSRLRRCTRSDVVTWWRGDVVTFITNLPPIVDQFYFCLLLRELCGMLVYSSCTGFCTWRHLDGKKPPSVRDCCAYPPYKRYTWIAALTSSFYCYAENHHAGERLYCMARN